MFRRDAETHARDGRASQKPRLTSETCCSIQEWNQALRATGISAIVISQRLGKRAFLYMNSPEKSSRYWHNHDQQCGPVAEAHPVADKGQKRAGIGWMP